MSTYLKLFETHTQYNEFIGGGGGVDRPNVSHCIAENEVHYNPIQPETRLVVKYNVTDTSSETTLLFDTTPFRDMEIDGVTQPSVVSSYAFDTLGVHTVKYTLADPTTIGGYFDGIENVSYFFRAPVSEVTIPNSVTSIGDSAFSSCSSLSSVTIGNGVTSIGFSTFYNCSGLTSVTIPDSVTNIDSQAFSYCSGLTSVTIGSGVTSIGFQAFSNCRSLTSITIPNSVTSIGMSAFVNCSALTSVTIGSGVTTISDGAFVNCSALTSVTIGSGVTSIGSAAFQGCSGLTSIVSLATTAPTITNLTFENVKTDGTLTVPKGSTGYDTWMGTGNYYLGKYNWTKVE